MYNCTTGTQAKVVYSKKYGVSNIKVAPSEDGSAVICASHSPWDSTIRYLSLHTNSFLRYFKGHTNKVTSLAMSPLDDTFCSGSLDETVRFWDLRTNVCQGLLRLTSSGIPSVGYDPAGQVLGVTCGSTVRMYDPRMLDGGPFAVAKVEVEGRPVDWRYMKFSPCGQSIALTGAKEAVIQVIDSTTLLPRATLYGHGGAAGPAGVLTTALEHNWTPDAKFIMSGSESGSVFAWEVPPVEEKGVAVRSPVAEWHGHAGPVRAVGFNPKYCMAASGCTNVCLWLPSLKD